ncbi:MAG: tandem-95 repeat protein, partial [Anaerolineales bacterium]|nr:tandem-95 repeat protein [Anaerolineales bacterium]
NFFGTEVFTYTISDGNGGFDTATVTVTVNPQNDDPTANDDNYVVNEDSGLTNLTVLDNDNTLPETGETLTITAVGPTANGGTAVANGGTSIDYTPAADFFGTETFTYTIGDGNGGFDTATVTITVNPQNDNPTAVADAFAVNEDSLNTALNVLGNDLITPDSGETLSITAVGPTDNGGTATNTGTAVAYTPAADFFGTETFTYTISDGNGGVDTATVTVTVNPQNDDPTANDDGFTVTEDSTANNLTVLSNDTILPDVGETLTVLAVGTPDQGGAVAINAMTTVDYTPAPDFFGTETFTYTVTDGNGGLDTATVTVTVDPQNDNPTAVDDYFSFAGVITTVSLDVLLNDLIAPDTGETLSLSAVGVPDSGGAAVVNGTVIDYTPTVGFASTETFTYTVTDSNGGVDTALVVVAINDNRPNLAISSIQFDRNLVCRGEEVLVQFSISNPGNGNAGAHAIAFYDDAQAAAFLNTIGSLNIQGLPAANTFNFNVAYIPAATGVRYFKVLADANNVIAESVEADNGAFASLTVLDDPAPSGSMNINNGATYTSSPLITLNLQAQDSGSCATSVAQVRFVVNGQLTPWETYASTKQLYLAALDGEKVTIYAQFRDENNNTSNFIGQSITLDTAAPQTSVNSPSGNTTTTSFNVLWSGTDIGSGIQQYDVQVNDNGGGWVDWQSNTTATNATFSTAEIGHTYCFRSRGLDAAGNLELYPAGNGDSCVTVQEVSSGADLRIVNVEYTQAIQNDSNSVPLIAERPLLVRIEVGLGADGQPLDGVTAELHAYRNGQPLPGSPLRPLNAPITAQPNPDDTSSTDLLHFHLPTAWLVDTVQLYIELDPDNTITESDESNNRFPANDFETLTFNQTADLEIIVVPIIWEKDGQTYTVSPADIASFYDYILRTYPISDVSIRVHNAHRYEGSSIEWVPLLNEIKAIRTAELPRPAPNQKYYGLIPFPYDSYAGTAGVGYRPGKDAIGFAIGGDTQGIIAAHELAHNFGRQHVASTDANCGVPAAPDPQYPYAQGRINNTGWDFGKDAFLPESTHDFMS